MKFTSALAVLASAAAVSVSAHPSTNGERMARGLPLLPPSRRWTPTAAARRSAPSNQPSSSCNTGNIQCCNSVSQANDPLASLLIGLLGIVGVPTDVSVGITCSPLSAIGLSSNSCTQQPVCCENNKFNGIIAIGCTPINIHL